MHHRFLMFRNRKLALKIPHLTRLSFVLSFFLFDRRIPWRWTHRTSPTASPRARAKWVVAYSDIFSWAVVTGQRFRSNTAGQVAARRAQKKLGTCFFIFFFQSGFFFFGSFFRMRVRVCVELSGGDTRSSQQGRELCVFVYVHTCRWLPETFLPFIRKLNPRQRFSSCSWTRMSAREAQRRNNVLQLSYGERDRVRRREMGNNSSTLLSV